jgi:S1-C subfamily serine protease
VIVAIDGARIVSLPELRDALSGHEPGDVVQLRIYRGSKQLTVRAVLGRQPTTP